MRIFLVRHGQSQANLDDTTLRATADHRVNLSPLGRKQARDAGEFLKAHLPDEGKIRLWVSPFHRTRQTADEIEKAVGGRFLDRREEELLHEQHMGIFAGHRQEEIEKLFPREWAVYNRAITQEGRFWAQPPQGESWVQVTQRVKQFFETLHRHKQEDEIETVVIVAHYVVINCFIKAWMRYPYEWLEGDLDCPNCCVTELKIGQKENQVFAPTQRT